MKKLFVLITVLITLSLLGIILLQVSWLKNNVILREDQVRQKIDNAIKSVALELIQYKAQYATPYSGFYDNNLLLFNRGLHEMSRLNTLFAKMNQDSLYKKIRRSFNNSGLEELNFEFALILNTSMPKDPVETQSPGYKQASQDTIHNYSPGLALIAVPSGSTFENLSQDESLSVIALNYKKIVMKSLTGSILLAILFTLVIIAAFFVTVYTMLRQKKLGEIKNDFINNMTHEFKTPIATISLAVDALKNEKVLSDKTKMSYFSGIIKEENQRMNKQVEAILKASQFEKQEVELDKGPLHVHEIIKLIVDKFLLQLQEKNGKAELSLNASNDLIRADEVHFTNLVNNLVDNAVKYSKDHVPILLKITSQNINGRLILRFEDNGIGMSKETQKRVFEKFYRAHTGNLHNVKGFGLGLNYVKSVTQSHGGSIKVESTLGKGSTFVLEFPLDTGDKG
ncbi:two-component sensor histidine kinase [Niabella ginsenosidivorans]|uniref:histidine kinase n=1 Tax=Niabella ginsenosidivorans TaxID=1176587 RepID=A0A1A9I3J5_9BACT|nr:HAMP domain-containing sensor histidine kinase [Niabella ginsenosidivorans]ANH82196.1 two-component sensor histidine kinase [Niabella ginsenosidivorans]